MKSTRMIELRTTMPAPAMKPIIDVAVKNAPIDRCAGRMPTSEKGIAAMTISGVRNERNQPTIRMKIRTSTAAKACAQIAEHFDGDVPFAIPFQGRSIVVKGWTAL